MKNPAVLFYTADFITGTLFMTNEEVGAYIRILCMQHQKGHLSKNEILQICKTEEIFNSISIHFNTDENGLYFNKRMDLEKEKRTKYSESRANNRSKKDEDIKKICKTYEKDMKNICNSYEKHMENENININNNINKNNKYFNNKELNNIFKEYLKIRIKLKAVNSERAINSLLKKLEPYEDDIKYKMIEQSIINSWKSIYELKDDYGSKKVGVVPEWLGKDIKKGDFSEETERLCREVFGNNKE